MTASRGFGDGRDAIRKVSCPETVVAVVLRAGDCWSLFVIETSKTRKPSAGAYHSIPVNAATLYAMLRRLFGLAELGYGYAEHPHAHGADDGERQAQRDQPAAPGDARAELAARQRADRQVVEHRVPHRIDDVGERIDPGQHR